MFEPDQLEEREFEPLVLSAGQSCTEEGLGNYWMELRSDTLPTELDAANWLEAGIAAVVVAVVVHDFAQSAVAVVVEAAVAAGDEASAAVVEAAAAEAAGIVPADVAAVVGTAAGGIAPAGVVADAAAAVGIAPAVDTTVSGYVFPHIAVRLGHVVIRI